MIKLIDLFWGSVGWSLVALTIVMVFFWAPSVVVALLLFLIFNFGASVAVYRIHNGFWFWQV